MRRISPFHSTAGFFSWFFLGESVLGALHLGEFSVTFVRDVFGWMQVHFFVDFFIGLGLIFLRIEWPRIEPRIPAWLRFKTVHDRLHTIEEEHLPAIRESHGVISGRLADIDQHAKTLDILSDNHGTKLENLVHRITALENSQVASEQAFHALPLFVRGCIEIEGLARDNFALYQKFANSTPEERRKDLDAHLQRLYCAVRDYRALDKIRNSATKLQVYVTALRSGEAPPEDQDEAFRDIQKFLDEAISDHAANFVASTPASSTTKHNLSDTQDVGAT